MLFVILILFNILICTSTLFSPLNRRNPKKNKEPQVLLTPSVCNRSSYWDSLNLAEMTGFKHLEKYKLTDIKANQATAMNCTGIISIRLKKPCDGKKTSTLSPALENNKLVYTSHELYLKYICELISCGQECFEVGQKLKHKRTGPVLPKWMGLNFANSTIHENGPDFSSCDDYFFYAAYYFYNATRMIIFNLYAQSEMLKKDNPELTSKYSKLAALIQEEIFFDPEICLVKLQELALPSFPCTPPQEDRMKNVFSYVPSQMLFTKRDKSLFSNEQGDQDVYFSHFTEKEFCSFLNFCRSEVGLEEMLEQDAYYHFLNGIETAPNCCILARMKRILGFVLEVKNLIQAKS